MSVLHDAGCILIVDALHTSEVVGICMHIMELIWDRDVSVLHVVGCTLIVDILHAW